MSKSLLSRLEVLERATGKFSGPVFLLWGCDGRVGGYSWSGPDGAEIKVWRKPGESDRALLDRAEAHHVGKAAVLLMAFSE